MAHLGRSVRCYNNAKHGSFCVVDNIESRRWWLVKVLGGAFNMKNQIRSQIYALCEIVIDIKPQDLIILQRCLCVILAGNKQQPQLRRFLLSCILC